MKDSGSIHQRVLQYAHAGTDALYLDFQISPNGYDDGQVEKKRQQ